MNAYIVFDVETPNARNDKICSIGLTLIDNGEISETKSYLVNPESIFDAKNVSVHGITAADVKDAPLFSEIWKAQRHLFSERIVVAHNATFDLNVLKKALKCYSISEDSIMYVDTLTMSKWVYPRFAHYGLDVLCAEFGIPLRHHDSESDSQACATLLCKMLAENAPVENFIKIFDLSTYDDCPANNLPKRKLSDTSNSLLELKEIFESIAEDGVIEERELQNLICWLNCHEALRGNYPYDEIYSALCKICEDGVVTQCELKELLSTLYSLTDPLKNSDIVKETQCVCGKAICLSGEFLHGTKECVSNILVEHGATIQNTVSKRTDIVLVGDCGNEAWLAGNYGTKIKKALELREKGIEISIVKECDLFAIMDK